eukprot:TRINITY_DN351_c0_g1_i3.p1 TRINITY_DN351_c0_g1~~TRINITY_DN351_c0_g1_i3.p1  ORF type:complete len:271 (+),score=100.53 TRINITY_DN351_c0_g1_i3:32-814(+)
MGEEAMLSRVCKFARLPARPEAEDKEAGAAENKHDNDFHVLDLGCGWGSFALYVASNYPHIQVTAVSNSSTQRQFIEEKARSLNLTNLRVLTANVVELTFPDNVRFDRVCSTEMFEHMKNYELLMGKVASWLKPNGLLFVHIFVNRNLPYHFEDGWMARTFFTGGTMPSDHLLLHFQDDLSLVEHQRINGNHYKRTLDAWLDLMDKNIVQIRKMFAVCYGENKVNEWVLNWRLFFLACSELFGFQNGEQWFVSHYLFEKK